MKKYVYCFALAITLGAGITVQGANSSHFQQARSLNVLAGEATWPSWLTDWLDQGGPIPSQLVSSVIHQAAPWGWEKFGITEEQMLEDYSDGGLTIEFVPNSNPILTFKVARGGLGITVITDDY